MRLKPLGHLSTWKIGRQYSGRVPGYNPRSRPAAREIPEALLAPQPFDLAGIPIDGTATLHRHRLRRNDSGWLSLFWQTKKEVKQEDVMGRGLLLWLLGIPIPIIILIWVLGGLHG